MYISKKEEGFTCTLKLASGFTLIELLVVVAIIGILASVVVASLNSAKKKGEDSAVATNLHTVANQAELFFNDNGNSYLPATNGVAIGITTPCPTYASGGTNMFSNNKVLADAIVEATLRGNGNSCYNSSNSWAVAVGLKTTSGTSWCVDNTGVAKQEALPPEEAIDPNTFACK